MVKRKLTEINFNPKKRKFIDIIYSEFDSDPDSEDDPEWLPDSDDSFSSDSDSDDSDDSFSLDSDSDDSFSSDSDSDDSDSEPKSDLKKTKVINDLKVSFLVSDSESKSDS